MPFESELLEADVLAVFPAAVQIPAALVAREVEAEGSSSRVLVVLDDDPTGTQSVADWPVLMRWEVSDFVWAFGHEVDGRRARAVYVLTNTRSLDPAEAAARNERLAEAERRGKKLLYRMGPPFVRARIGQEVRTELSGAEAYAGNTPSGSGGLIVVGSHVGVTTRQLKVLTDQHSAARTVEIDVGELLGEAPDSYLDGIVDTVVAGLAGGDVILHTSRLLIKTDDAAESLRIARTVSAAVVAVVNRTLKLFPPRFVIDKGGITSSDVAAHGLEIRHPRRPRSRRRRVLHALQPRTPDPGGLHRKRRRSP